MEQSEAGTVLLVRVPAAVCALPLSQVIETMRPLPISPIGDAPDFLCGIAVIRGAPTPVIELEALFESNGQARPERFVTMRNGGRVIALAVQNVIGVAEPQTLNLVSLPPLLKNARRDAIDAIGTLDEDLLVMLQTAALVPESVWKSLGIYEAAL